MQECTGKYTFDSGIALQFAMFILQKPQWKTMMNIVPPLHELTKAVHEYYRYVMCPYEHHDNNMLLTNIMGFKVNDPNDKNAQTLTFLFYKTLAEFYEQSVIPFYVHLSHYHLG